jgi:tetratricopeptide (TPR) repeat protein
LGEDPNNARLHNDYGTALLEKGRAAGLEFLAESLKHFDKALELDGSMAEALFNRALAYEEMSLPSQAEESWAKYLEQDRDSPWADEARRRLQDLEERRRRTSPNREKLFEDFMASYQAGDDERAWQIISGNRDLTGSFIENNLIDAYLDFGAKGQMDKAAEAMRALSYAGRLEVSRAGDYFIRDLAEFYESAPPDKKADLARARSLVSRGHEHLDQSQLKQAMSMYTSAQRIFKEAGDECEALYVEYPLGHYHLLRTDSKLGLAVFEALIQKCEARQYRLLLAQSLNGKANALIGLNEYSLAIDNSLLSPKISEQINDTNGVLKALLQLSREYLYLGDHHRSLGVYQRILSLPNAHAPEPMQVWRNYYSIAQTLNALGLYAAAAEYFKASLWQALEMNIPQIISRSYINLGLSYGQLKDFTRAFDNVRLGLEVAGAFSDESAHAESLTYSALQYGNLYRLAGDFSRSIEYYDQAIRLYDEGGHEIFSYAARKGKLISCIEQGGCPSVEEQIKTVIDIFEEHRKKILEESRSSLINTSSC